MIFETTLNRLPVGIIFWKADDGVIDHNGTRVQEYAPRKSYVRIVSDTHDVRDLNEFGRTWTLAECGLAEDSPVRTTFQPIAKQHATAAWRASQDHLCDAVRCPLEGLEAAREQLAKAERRYRECLHACFDYRHVPDRDIARAAGLTRQRVHQIRKGR